MNEILNGLLEDIRALQVQRNKISDLRARLDAEIENLKRMETELTLKAAKIKSEV